MPPAVRDSIQRLTALHPGDLIGQLTALLATYGYLSPEITVSHDSVVVMAGERAVLSRVELYGDTAYAVSILEKYSDALVMKSLQRVVAEWTGRGFLYARAVYDSTVVSGDSAVAFCRLIRGAASVLGDVQCIGLERTNRLLLQRMVNLNREDTITTALLVELEERLSNLSFVRYVGPAEIQPHEGFTAVELIFRFEEIPQIEVFGGFGYLPDDKSGLTWSGRAQLRNLFGTGKSVRIDSRRPQKQRNELDVAYSQPVFLGGIGEWGVDIHTRDYIGQFYEFQVQSTWDVRSGPGSTLGGVLGWKSVENESAPSFTAWSAGVRASFSGKMSGQNGDDSWRARTEFTSIYRRFRADSSYAQINSAFDVLAGIDIEATKSLFRSFALTASAGYHGLKTKDSIPTASEMVNVGGPPLLRGYRTDQFSAIDVVSGSVEPGVGFSSGRTGLFLDAAWMSSRDLSNGTAIT
ncbi:MAG: hypothetical protein HY851_10310, partial [candidate division Zixibacteria bacterium]|nr:hypothetical protein [candidate division Zixibacteria bacterium]